MNAEITTPIMKWQPKDGESLIGQIVGTRKESGIYGENTQVLVKGKYGIVTAVWLTK